MFMESWILRVSCKVGFTYFARDPKYSWFHEQLFQRLNSFLNKLFVNWKLLHALCSPLPKSTLSNNSFKNTVKSVKQFGSRSGPTFCRSWLASTLFAKVISRQKNAAGRQLPIMTAAHNRYVCFYALGNKRSRGHIVYGLHACVGMQKTLNLSITFDISYVNTSTLW